MDEQNVTWLAINAGLWLGYLLIFDKRIGRIEVSIQEIKDWIRDHK